MRSEQNGSVSWRWLFQVLFVLVWLAALIAAYFGLHKPASADVVRATLETVGSLGLWLLLTALAAAVGRRLVGSLLDGEPLLARLALTAGLGLGIISLLVMALGMLGLLARWQVLLALLGLVVLALPGLPATWRDVRGWRWPVIGTPWQRWFWIYGLASLGMALALALAPPTAWDSLVYHLTGPRLYLETGRIGHPIDLAFLGYPALGEMHFLLALILWSDRAAALFHFGYGLMGLILSVALAWRIAGETAAWFAGVVYLSVPTLFSLMHAPYVDLALLYYTSGSFYLFVRWREAYLTHGRERGWLILLGLFIGFAGGLKYTAIATPLALGGSILFVARDSGASAAVRRVTLVAFVAMAAVAIWPLKDWLSTGNPFYPFFLNKALYWDEWRSFWFDRPGTGVANGAPWRLITAPVEATVAGIEGSELYDATIGPLLLGGLGLVFLIWRWLPSYERTQIRHMLVLVGLNYALWLYGIARSALVLQTRLLFPIFGLLATLAGTGFAYIDRLRRPQLDAGWLVRAIITLTLSLLLVTQLLSFLDQQPLPVLFGVESRSEYERRQLGLYADVMEEVNDLPAGSRVVFLWEPRSYACKRVQCWPDGMLDRIPHRTQYLQQDAAAIAAGWQALGFTHVLWYEYGMQFFYEADSDPLGPADLVVFAQLQDEYLRPVEVWQDAYILYELSR